MPEPVVLRRPASKPTAVFCVADITDVTGTLNPDPVRRPGFAVAVLIPKVAPFLTALPPDTNPISVTIPPDTVISAVVSVPPSTELATRV